MLKTRFALCTAFITLSLLPLHAQDAQTRRRVVGIALSGGGALGLAHIGVLRYLEEQHIPVDRIAGTSMGGLLGGLYATGHDSSALEKIIREADWDDLLRLTPNYEDRAVVEKQEWNRITGQYSLEFGKGFTLPAGINRGQALVLLLSGETAAYADVRDFDNLPIPFRCVATDLVAGEAFVLNQGYLTKALRATMAIPGIFTPVDWDGHVLSDGGLVNNLPTDVAKAMGSEVIIAVTLRIAPTGAKDLYTLPNILRQTTNIAVVQNELRNLPLADIEIQVQLGNRGTFDFSDTKSIIELGYQAAVANRTALERLSVSPDQWDQYLRNRKGRERSAPDAGPLVEVSASQASIQRNAFDELRRKTGQVVSRGRLEDNLSGMTAATGLSNAFYGWRAAVGRPPGYAVEIETRRNTEILVRPSFFYQLSSAEPSRATVRLSGAAILKNAYKSRLLADVFLGGNPGVFLEYYHPFGGTAYFVSPGLSVDRVHNYAYDGKIRTDRTRDRFAGALYIGIGTWRYAQLRVGAQAGFDKYASEVSNTGFVNPEIHGVINSQDSGQLPNRGFRLNASGGWSFRERSYPYLRMTFDHFQPVGHNVSLFAAGQADTGMGYKLTFYDQFTTGGLTQLDAYRYQELRADTVLVGGFGVLYRGANPKNLAFRPIFGSWYQVAGLDSFERKAQFKQSGSVGVFAPTPLGLAGLTFSVDMSGSTRVRLSIGSFWNRP